MTTWYFIHVHSGAWRCRVSKALYALTLAIGRLADRVDGPRVRVTDSDLRHPTR